MTTKKLSRTKVLCVRKTGCGGTPETSRPGYHRSRLPGGGKNQLKGKSNAKQRPPIRTGSLGKEELRCTEYRERTRRAARPVAREGIVDVQRTENCFAKTVNAFVTSSSLRRVTEVVRGVTIGN